MVEIRITFASNVSVHLLGGLMN